MHKIDSEYLDKYDELNKLCRKVTGGAEGVTGYINAMAEIKDAAEKVPFWNEDLNTLRHLRDLYSQITMNDTERNIYGSRKDIQDVDTFYNRIKQGSDPLSSTGRRRSAKKPSISTILLIIVAVAALAAWIIVMISRS